MKIQLVNLQIDDAKVREFVDKFGKDAAHEMYDELERACTDELKKNLKDSWWKFHVQDRDDVVGIDGSIITHPKVWEASGHVANFMEKMLECSKCGEELRADHFIEEKTEISKPTFEAEEINQIVKDNDLKCPKCKSDFKEVNDFLEMFITKVGPKQDDESIAYLRPETAQLMFADFILHYLLL